MYTRSASTISSPPCACLVSASDLYVCPCVPLCVQHEKADNAPMPSYFSFVFTSIDGDRVHVACLQFYEMLPLKTLRALEVRGDSPRGMHPARIAQRMHHADALPMCLHVWVQTKQRILTVAGSFSPSTDAGGGTDARWDEDEDSVRCFFFNLQ